MILLDTRVKTAKPKAHRSRKVYYAYYDHEFGSPHPVIRLGGKYLATFGFNIGDSIEVHLEVGRITITKAHDGTGLT